MSPSEGRQIRARRVRPNRACIERRRTGLDSSKMISLSSRKTTFSQASLIALPSVARPSGSCLIRGFAPSPRGEFALVGKGLSVLEEHLCENQAGGPDNVQRLVNPSSWFYLVRPYC